MSESNKRDHWAARHRRMSAHRGTALLVLRPHLHGLRWFALDVTLTRIAPLQLDDDNLRGALKGVRDGVADALGIDDRDRRVEWRYGQRKGGVREYAVEIAIR